MTAAGPGRRLKLGEAWTAAVVATLVRPVSWALGLLGFLVGGGLLLVAWPVVVLPTPTGLQNMLGGPVTTLVFGVPTPGLVLLVGGSIAGAFALVVVAVVVGSWAERQGIAVTLDAAAEEGATPEVSLDGAPGTLRVTVVRLLALGPVIAVMALSSQRVYEVVYHELILPDDLATPLAIRVIRTVPLHLAAIVIAWLLSDAAAAIGVRRLVVERQSVGMAWLHGWAEVGRRPLRVIGTAIAGALLLALLLGPSLAAAAIGWTRVRDILVTGRDPVVTVVAVLVWVAIWLGSLVLASVAAGVRMAAWTMVALRPVPNADPAPDGSVRVT